MEKLNSDLEQREFLHGMSDFVEANLSLLSSPDKAWQPTDFLPDLSKEDWRDSTQAFRDACSHLSDDALVVLVGGMITEEALPNYAIALNNIAFDEDGDAPTPWSRWLRGWTAEENRHGDLLNAYLRLTGRVDMRKIELSIHHLISSGFNSRAARYPIKGLIYTTFQERATRISHLNTAKLVARQGDPFLEKICRQIAADETRHEMFYKRCMKRVFELDPETALLCFRDMLRNVISMPGQKMFDGRDPDLFDHYSFVAQKTGIYTINDYASIIEHLIETWGVGRICVTGKAAKAQDYICNQTERYDRYANEYCEAVDNRPNLQFNWIFDRYA